MTNRTLRLFSLLLVLAGIGSLAQAQHHEACDPDAPPAPVLNVADVNGDGIVDDQDVLIVIGKAQQAHATGFYYGLYDLNADGVIDGLDVAAAGEDIGKPVPLVETQVAHAALYAERYLKFDNVLADGYEATTPEFEGHGVHWWRAPRYRPTEEFETAVPGGLNLDAAGNLMAVYYAADFSMYPMETPPAGFSGHEDEWHMHTHACGWNFNTEDPERVTFIDYLPQRFGYYPDGHPLQVEGKRLEDFWFGEQGSANNTCTQPWLINYLMSVGAIVEAPPAGSIANYNGFHMLHLWVNRLNPCGRFGGTHPGVEGRPVTADPPGVGGGHGG
ncbi:MAG: hypothetical protein OEZ06_29185 [Myxococcales bacterium]|nr:hypothetical protein [Myxococcales bacterium]